MKIAIEIAPQFKAKRGIGNYTENLIGELAKLDRDNEYVLFGWSFRNHTSKMKSLPVPRQDNFKLLFRRFPESLADLIEWKMHVPLISGLLMPRDVDIYHSPGPRLPHLSNGLQVITMHDLIYEVYPQWVDQTFLAENRRAAAVADRIIVDSYYTKSDVVKYYHIDERKIEVVYLGVDRDIFRPVRDDQKLQETRQRYSLPEHFLFDIGPFEPRRNITSLLRAFAAIKSRLPGYKLVLVGEPTAQLQAEIRDLSLNNDVIVTGYVSLADLVNIYSIGGAFIHLSLYEGFGLPVLEAFACGCPVIASNRSSLPEVVGDAGILPDPLAIDEISQAILKIITDEGYRRQLIEAGLNRAAQFTWAETARKTLEVYKSLS